MGSETKLLCRHVFGFGGYQDTAAYFSNVSAYAENGTLIYSNDLTSTDVLEEYGVAPNSAAVCLDGPKRDRLIWLGDFYHTSRIVPASTARWNQIVGTLEYLAAWANAEGLLNISPPLGYPSSLAYDVTLTNFIDYYALEDYQMLGLSALYSYYERTGDLTSVKELYPAYQAVIAALLPTIDTATNLSTITGFLGPASSTAVNALFVQALTGAATIARDLKDTTSARAYTAVARQITHAINTQLWNADLGVYAVSAAFPNDYSVAGISFAITSGVASTARAKRALKTLDNLKLGPGYKDSTLVNSSDPTVNLSPNTNGFLLSAAMLANDTAPVAYLLQHL